MQVRLVGRDAETAVIAAAVDATAGRAGRVVLLTGDPGIGKSRLAGYALRLAAKRGFATLEGSAHALHAGLAYAPVVQAIRRHLSGLPGVESAPLLAGLADLGRLLDDPRLPPAPPLGDPELERTRMFEAVARLFERLADRQPVALFVDDLHWADRGTIELLHYLSRSARGRRVLLLANYRSGEQPRPLREFATAVRRHDLDTELTLRPLTDDAVAELLAELLGAPASPQLLENVRERARGVPLFVKALVQEMGRTPAPSTPAVVRDLVLAQLDRLGEPSRRLLDLVAVAGETAPDVLAEVLPDDFAEPQRDLLARGLLSEEESGRSVRLRVDHPMYAEVAYAELTAADRRDLHARLAAAIEKLTPDDILALAPHYLEASDRVDSSRATDVLSVAGQRALDIHAADEAVRYFRAALAGAGPDFPAERRIEVLIGLGRGFQEAGNLGSAAAVWNEGVALAQDPGLAEQHASLRYRLALLETERGNLSLADQHSHAGAAIGLREADAGDAEAMALRLVYSMRSGDTARMRAASEHTAALAAVDPSPTVRAAAHIGRSLLAWIDGDFRLARTEGERAVAYSGRSPMIGATANRMLISMAVADGDLPAAFRHAQAGLDTLTEYQLPSAMASAYYSLAMVHYLAGELGTALATVDTGLETARRSSGARAVARLLLCRAFLLTERGRHGPAADCIADAAQTHPLGTSGDTPVTAIWELSRTALALLNGKPKEAPKVTVVPLNDDAIVMWQRPAFAGYAALATGDADQVAAMVAKLREFGFVGSYIEAVANRLDGLHQASLDRTTEAAELLAGAADSFASMGMPLLASQTRLEWVELTGKSADLVAGCLETFQRCDATPWIDRCRRLGRTLGLRLTPTRRAGNLSNRETQVVQLVAEGLSNSQIAAQLFLSERTVETHLRNAYARLGISSRVALAKWVAENRDT